MGHRSSYWKTTALAFIAGASCIALLASGVTSGSLGIAAVPVSLVLGAVGLTSLLVTAGGCVCLWRDARESTGQPDLLARLAIRPPTRVPLRFLFGPRLQPGDLVEVRPRHEIDATLDHQGTLAGLPFMEEMTAFCGKVFQVHRRVDHVNDMRNKTGLRRIHDVVTLTAVRCSGAAHGGCQAECQILWKDAWLRRIPDSRSPVESRETAVNYKLELPSDDDRAYVCQMTRLWEASHPIAPREIRHQFCPLITGNVGIADFAVAMLTRVFNVVQRLRGGAGYPFMPHSQRTGSTPSMHRDLRSGDAVVIRNKHEIAATLVNGRNRGLWFDLDMVRFCGQPAIVRKRVSRLIHEGTGKMIVMKTPCLMLENVIATGEFLDLCPQHEYIFWREIWLERARRPSTTTEAPTC
jgi:hypothetical protein